MRSDDVVARLGGDEFAIILQGNGQADYRQLAARIRNIVAQTNFEMGGEHPTARITVSVGIAVVQDSDTHKSLMERADKALYRSKELGRNLVHAWDANNALVDISARSDSAL